MSKQRLQMAYERLKEDRYGDLCIKLKLSGSNVGRETWITDMRLVVADVIGLPRWDTALFKHTVEASRAEG